MNYKTRTLLHVLLIYLIVLLMPAEVLALISISHGNRPIENMGLPLGSEKVANLPSRLGFWEGPPFGGGEYHFLYRCKNNAEFNEALKIFAAIQTPGSLQQSATSKNGEVTFRARMSGLELIVHDGPEYIFWLDGGKDDEDSKEKARIDWTFTVWRPKNWHRLFNNPKSFFDSRHPNFRQPVPPPQIDVYIGGGGSVVWKDVKVPSNIFVIDKREGHGPIKPVGGGLVCGDVYDMAAGQPIAGAEITLLKRNDSKEWEEAVSGRTDDSGSFKIIKIPAGRYEIRIQAEGYATRAHGYYNNKGITYHEFAVELMRQASIKGVVMDSDDKPLSGVKVSARNTLGIDGLGYECPDAETAITDNEGRFEIFSLPEGFTRIKCNAPSLHQQTSISELFDVPSDDIKIVMTGTGIVRGKVVGSDNKPPTREFIVELEPKGGNKVGSWGGSKQCDKDGGFIFKGVPPGEYVVITKPNPMREGEASLPKPVTITVGKTVELKIVNRYTHDEKDVSSEK